MEGHAIAELVWGNLPRMGKEGGKELLPKGKVRFWFSAFPRETSGFGAMFD